MLNFKYNKISGYPENLDNGGKISSDTSSTYSTVPYGSTGTVLVPVGEKIIVETMSNHQNTSPTEMMVTTGYGNISVDIIGDSFVDLFCFLEEALPEEGGDARLQHPIR